MHIIHLTRLVFLFHLCGHMSKSTVNGFQQQTQHCPRMCICGIHNGLNLANCSNENLISANIGMPSLVEYLDLSYNDITTVDNDCFKDLRHLNTVLLNRNSISFIELDAFLSLSKLQTVNLTYNRLESFDNRIFEQNLHLTSVDLSGNKFMHLPNAPILRSTSLETLDLHKSQLTHLHVNYFEHLPNIQFIDLSENLLIVLNLAAFATNNRLQQINIHHNRIRCDEQTEMSIIWLTRIHVDVFIENCPKRDTKDSTPPKFERILMLPSNITASHPISTSINNTFTDLNSVWNTHNENDHNIPILSERCSANETTANHACHLFEMCVSNLSMLVKEVEAKLRLKSGNTRTRYDSMYVHHSWYEFVTVQVAFYGGLLLGVMFGAIMLFTLKLISDCVMTPATASDRTSARKRRNRLYRPSEIRDANDNDGAIANGPINSVNRQETGRELIPVNNRRSGQSTSFFAILYERPVRHRYYRQINRSASNLVRRLSQSRLFLNSSRAQNAAYRSNYTRRTCHETANVNLESESLPMCNDTHDTANTDLTPDEETTDADVELRFRASIQSLNIPNDNNQTETENRLSAIRTFASENDICRSSERSETPPPPYNVVALAHNAYV